MESKSAINFSSIPASVNYKDVLKSSSDFVRDSRKVTIIPSSSGAFGPGSQTECTIMIDDGGAGAFLHPDSCYVTCDILTTTAVGGSTGTATANFNSSANDIIDRVQVRGRRSRVMLADCRDFNVWSALRDKLRYPESYEGNAPWSRGFINKIKDGHPDADTIAGFSESYGLASRGAANVAELGSSATNRRYKIELSYCPFFANDKVVPLSSAGGLELNLTFARVNDAFVGYQNANQDPVATTLDYRVTNLRFHCMISYFSSDFMQRYNSAILSGGIAIPYESYIALSHVPQSTNESVRLSSSLEHLRSVFAVHRLTADLNKITKPSLAHFGNPLLEEIQLQSGGIVQPTTPLITAVSAGTNVTGQMMEELQQAAQAIDPHLKGKDLQLQKESAELKLITAAKGTEVASETGPKFAEVAGWNGCHIVGLKTDGGSPYSSIYNKTSSTEQSPARKSDLMATLKYTGDPSAYTTNFFLYHGNVLHVRPNGMMIPEQLSF